MKLPLIITPEAEEDLAEPVNGTKKNVKDWANGFSSASKRLWGTSCVLQRAQPKSILAFVE